MSKTNVTHRGARAFAIRAAWTVSVALALVGCSDYGGSLGFAGAPGDNGADAADVGPAFLSFDDAAGLASSTGTGAGSADASLASDASIDAGLDAGAPGVPDTGAAVDANDGATLDSGLDADAADVGTLDADGATGTLDTGIFDTGAPDTSAHDATATNPGTADSGGTTTGQPDSGGTTTGQVDASGTTTGQPDSGPADSGSGGPPTVDSGADASGQNGSDAGCDFTNPNATTQTCFASRDKASSSPELQCSTCVQASLCYVNVPATMFGGTCEMLTGNATLLAGPLPDGKTCSQVFAPLTAPISERAICLAVIGNVLQSACAASLQETPCLCGTTDVTACLAGSATPTGAAYDQYACDYGSANGSTINSDFLIPTFGAGEANQLIQCAAAFGCECF